MIANMIQRYQNMLQNTLNIPNQQWGNILQALTPLTNIVRQGQAIAYSMANLDVRFRQRFPDYGNFLNANFGAPQMYGSYQGWYTTQRDGIDGALLAANLQSSQFANENATMATLTAMGDSATGRMQALQVGNQIANQQVQQMQKLRQLVMAQMQMQANYMAAEAAKDAAKNAQAEKFWQAPRNIVVGDGQRFTTTLERARHAKQTHRITDLWLPAWRPASETPPPPPTDVNVQHHGRGEGTTQEGDRHQGRARHHHR